jgi:hypothetical protein
MLPMEKLVYKAKEGRYVRILNKFNQLSVAVLDFQACLVQ